MPPCYHVGMLRVYAIGMTLNQFRRALYKTQRTIGDGQAAKRGPNVYAKRIVRRRVTRAAFRLLR